MSFATSIFVKQTQAYQLLQLDPIGIGSFAYVYHARHRDLQRDVAVKAVHPGLAPAQREQARQRLRYEAQLHSRLLHEHIVPARTLEHDHETDELYLVCDFCAGGSLASWLRNEPIAERQAVILVSGLLDALSYLHGQLIIHQDLKPANILLQRSSQEIKALIADFGSARDLGKGAKGGESEPAPMLTPEYCAPEQLGSVPASDERADIFALGIILAEMISGYAPLKPRLTSCRNPRALNNWLHSIGHPQLSPRLWRIILRATETDPQRRFQQAAEFQRSLNVQARSVRSASPHQPKQLSWQQELGIGLARLSAVLALGGAAISGVEYNLYTNVSTAIASLRLPATPALNLPGIAAYLDEFAALATTNTTDTSSTPATVAQPALPNPTLTDEATSQPALPNPTRTGEATGQPALPTAMPTVVATSRPVLPAATPGVVARAPGSRPPQLTLPNRIERQNASPIPLPEAFWPPGPEAPLAAPPVPVSNASLPW